MTITMGNLRCNIKRGARTELSLNTSNSFLEWILIKVKDRLIVTPHSHTKSLHEYDVKVNADFAFMK